jgi:transposase InsO family protein
MKSHNEKFTVIKMAKTLEISRSWYYAWLKSKPSLHKLRDQELLTSIKKFHEDSRQIYGSPRIKTDMDRSGIRCSKKRVERLMKENGIKGRQKRRFKVTTDSQHDYPVAPNLLNRQFNVKQPNTYWVSDITYVWTMEGWLYLCVIIDLFSRMVVGWSMAGHMRAELAIDALNMAVAHRTPSAGLIFHSDRGIQYACDDFRKELCRHEMIQSMSRKGNCWDNACAESFFASLKTEEVFRRKYKTRYESRFYIFEYIAVFYNRKRIHSFLDFSSPEEYELLMSGFDKVA